MTAGFHTLPSGLQDGSGIPATSKVTANTRVSTHTGSVTLISDVFTWPGPSTTGNFLVPMTRVTINGTPAVNRNAAGQALNASGSPVPTVVVQADPFAGGT